MEYNKNTKKNTRENSGVRGEAGRGVQVEAERKNSLQQLSPCRNVKLPHAAQVCASRSSNSNSYTNNNNNKRGGSKKMKTIKIIFTRTFSVLECCSCCFCRFFLLFMKELKN